MDIVFIPNFKDRPSNPARCLIPQERIEINSAVWPFLTDEDKEFVLQHEIGHCTNKSYDEIEADKYALKKMALKKPYSLRNFVKSVKTISHNDKKRVYNAQREALIISAADGSKEAADLLKDPYFSYAHADGNKEISENSNKITLIVIVIIILIVVIICKTTKR